MAVRVRMNGQMVCAAQSDAEAGDVYIDDAVHHLLHTDLKIIGTDDEGDTWRVASSLRPCRCCSEEKPATAPADSVRANGYSDDAAYITGVEDPEDAVPGTPYQLLIDDVVVGTIAVEFGRACENEWTTILRPVVGHTIRVGKRTAARPQPCAAWVAPTPETVVPGDAPGDCGSCGWSQGAHE